MSLEYEKDLIPRAKELRKNATKQEHHLWYDFLRSCPIRFQRQKTIGRYIVDFYCHKAKLVIELDGDQHGEPEGIAYDERRTAYLKKQGLAVLRFSNADVDRGFENVCRIIENTVRSRVSPETAIMLPEIED